MGLILDKCCCTNETNSRFRAGEYEDFNTPEVSKLYPPIKQNAWDRTSTNQSHLNRNSDASLRSIGLNNGKSKDNYSNTDRKQKDLKYQIPSPYHTDIDSGTDKSKKSQNLLGVPQSHMGDNSSIQSRDYSGQKVRPQVNRFGQAIRDTTNLGPSDFSQKFVQENIQNYYRIGKIIGSGKYGEVRLCERKSFQKKRFALKSIARNRIHADLSYLEQEFEILKSVDHPNIIKFYEAYVDEKYFHLVTEFCGGGELFEHIISRGKFTESYASQIIKQVLSAIKHLHDKGICHRDLKPENILFESKSRDAQVKLIDFGLAKFYNPNPSNGQHHIMRTKIGTPYYMAPEVLEGAYDEACDMWSIGVITYCLLCGYPPFNAESDIQLFRKIKLCDYEFHMPEWGQVSEDAKNFIQRLIQPNPKLRMTPEQALAHSWIKSAPKEQISKTVMTRLALFNKPNMFQREVLLLLAALLNSKELKEIRETFSAIDEDSSGAISMVELKNAFRQAGQARKEEDIDEIIRKVDFDNNGEINYSEFISGTLDRSLISKDNLLKVFKYLDSDDIGLLTYDTLRQQFQRKGEFVEDKFDQMMQEIGLQKSHNVSQRRSTIDERDKDQGINFERFCEILGFEVPKNLNNNSNNNSNKNTSSTLDSNVEKQNQIIIPQLQTKLAGNMANIPTLSTTTRCNSVV